MKNFTTKRVDAAALGMDRQKQLDKVSGNFFLSGLIVSRLGQLGPSAVGRVSTFFSALFYLSGYGLWQLSAMLQHSKENTTFGNKRHLAYAIAASLFGITASLLLLLSLITSSATLPCTWLFLWSNGCWWYGEHLKTDYLAMHHPHSELYKAQSKYFNYAKLATLISLISAISITSLALYPAIMFPLMPAISINLFALNLFAFEKWLDSTQAFARLTILPSPFPQPPLPTTYSKLQQTEGFRYIPSPRSVEPSQAPAPPLLAERHPQLKNSLAELSPLPKPENPCFQLKSS